MKKDFFYTLLVNSIVMISGIVIYKLVKMVAGLDGFTEYSLSRRIISFLQPIFAVGLSVGLTRYISISKNNKDEIKRLFIFSNFLILISSFFLLVVSFLFKEKISFLLFGSSEYTYLIFPINMMVIGLLLHTVVYSFYRGNLIIKKANFLQLINLGIIPIVAIFFSKDVSNILSMTGLLWITVSSIILFLIFKEQKISYTDLKLLGNHRNSFIKLFLYSVGRVPADIGLAVLFSLPPILISHSSGVKIGGIVAFGISLVNMVASFFATIGIIMLPKVGMLYAERNIKLIKEYIKKLLKVAIILPVIGVLIFELWGDMILRIYLGKDFIYYSSIVKIIFIGIIPYVIYVSFRSIIDAVYEFPINVINILISLIIMVFISTIILFTSQDYNMYIFSFFLGLIILSILTVLSIIIIWRLKLN